ncbi:MAG TPA: hypothetical protein PKZ76_12650 [Xanthomonadaceae bacterium]|nr:hypothetical protein [Xanthomonadaceae bacterium]
MHEDDPAFEEAARQAVEMANRIAEQFPDTDLRDIADGLLSGAIHYWLYARQPCEDPACPDCADIATAELRTASLIDHARDFAQTSDYFHSPTDHNVGRA